MMTIHVSVRIIKKIVDFLIGLLKDQPEIVTFSGFITLNRYFWYHKDEYVINYSYYDVYDRLANQNKPTFGNVLRNNVITT